MHILTKVLLLCTCLFNLASAQTTFQKHWGGNRFDSGRDFVQLSNGDLLVTGISSSYSTGDSDVYLARLSPNGAEVWHKTFGGSGVDIAWDICPVGDGQFLITGSTSSMGNGGSDFYLLKIDESGNKTWEKTYGTSGRDDGHESAITPDGGIIIAGYVNTTPGAQDFHYALIKTDKDGVQQWIKEYAVTQNIFFDGGASVKTTPDGGYVLFGQTFTDFTNPEIYLLKTDGSGTPQWSKTVNQGGFNRGQYVYVNPDGTMMTVGDQEENTNGDYDINVRKWNSDGTLLWSKLYGGTDKDVGKKITPTSDGGYLIAGHTRSFGLINPDMWIVKIDASGTQLWANHYGGSNHEHCYAAMELSDGTYAALGHTLSLSGNEIADLYMIRDVSQQVTSSSNKTSSSLQVKVFPNPAQEQLSISGFTNQKLDVQLIDLTGRVILKNIFENEDLKMLSLKGVSKGVYIISMRTNEEILNQKLVVE